MCVSVFEWLFYLRSIFVFLWSLIIVLEVILCKVYMDLFYFLVIYILVLFNNWDKLLDLVKLEEKVLVLKVLEFVIV